MNRKRFLQMCSLTGLHINRPKLIAFTFDDGPSQYTGTLLDGLRKRDVAVTFFMNGENGTGGTCGIKNGYETLLDRMWKDGHQLANHTYHHAPLHKISAEQIVSEVTDVENLIFDALGGRYKCLVRTPGGHTSNLIARNVNAPIILWNVDTEDWKYRDADYIYGTILSHARSSSIVLMHDIYETSINGALRAVDALKEQNYEFVTVSELMRRTGVTLTSGTTYSKAKNALFCAPAYEAPKATVLKNNDFMTLTFSCPTNPELSIYYTTNGSYPKFSDNIYCEVIPVKTGTIFTAVGVDKWGTRTPATVVKIDSAPGSTP